jgi:hypothetical protein
MPFIHSKFGRKNCPSPGCVRGTRHNWQARVPRKFSVSRRQILALSSSLFILGFLTCTHPQPLKIRSYGLASSWVTLNLTSNTTDSCCHNDILLIWYVLFFLKYVCDVTVKASALFLMCLVVWLSRQVKSKTNPVAQLSAFNQWLIYKFTKQLVKLRVCDQNGWNFLLIHVCNAFWNFWICHCLIHLDSINVTSIMCFDVNGALWRQINCHVFLYTCI